MTDRSSELEDTARNLIDYAMIFVGLIHTIEIVAEKVASCNAPKDWRKTLSEKLLAAIRETEAIRRGSIKAVEEVEE